MSGRGGKREGAGRPAGALNKRTEENISAMEASGLSPLDYLLQVMRDETGELGARLEAAKAAAPYVHPKLSSIQFNGKLEVSHEDALEELG